MVAATAQGILLKSSGLFPGEVMVCVGQNNHYIDVVMRGISSDVNSALIIFQNMINETFEECIILFAYFKRK